MLHISALGTVGGQRGDEVAQAALSMSLESRSTSLGHGNRESVPRPPRAPVRHWTWVLMGPGGGGLMPQERQRPVYPGRGTLFQALGEAPTAPGAPGPTLSQAWVEQVVGMEIFKENRERSGRKWLG